MSVHPGKEDGCTLISIDYQRKNRRFRYAEGARLLGAEDTVTGIAQAGNDVAVLVQMVVHRTGGSADAAITEMKKRGCHNIKLMVLVAAPEGILQK